MLKAKGPALAVILLAGCGSEPAPPPPKAEKAGAEVSVPVAAPDPAGADRAGPPAGGGETAAAALKSYYALIEAGEYREAWKLRSSERGGGEEAFVESFGRYSSYRAMVGQPSEPAVSGGWIYVEVPVQIFGQLKSGEPFSSAGSVTLGRKEEGPAAERGWRIYS